MPDHAGTDYEANEESLRRGFEAREIHTRGILWFAIIFFGTLLVIHVVVWVIFRTVATSPSIIGAERSPLSETLAPAGPRLQPSLQHNQLPWQNLRQLQRDAHARLTGYGWVDQQEGIARIPIGQAMQLVLEQQAFGQQAQPAPATQPQADVSQR